MDRGSYINFVLMLLLLIGMAFTKLNGLAIMPVLMFFLLLLYYRKKGGLGKFFALLFIVGIVFLAVYLVYSGKYISLIEGATGTWGFATTVAEPRFVDYINHIPYTYLHLFNYPPNECLNQQIFGGLNEPLKLLFGIIPFPLFLLCVAAVIRNFMNKNLFWKMLSCVVIFNFGIIILQYLGLSVFILPRYLIPTIALMGILAARQYNNIENSWVKKIVLASFVLFVFYSFAYSGYSTYYHYKVYDLHKPSIDYMQNLSEENSQTLVSFMGERIKFYTRRKFYPYWGGLNRGEFVRLLEREKVTHIYYGCYWERIDFGTIQMMMDANSIREMYADKCGKVYEILYHMDANWASPVMQVHVGMPSPREMERVKEKTYRVDECH